MSGVIVTARRVTRKDGIKCRVCGGVQCEAAPPDPIENICKGCWNRFKYWKSHHARQDKFGFSFEAWLTRRFETEISRLSKHAIIGRCEAMSNWPLAKGFQCSMPAIWKRDGHKVCSRHSDAKAPTYIDSAADNPYRVLRDLLVEVAMKDDELSDAVLQAAAKLRSRGARSRI